MALFDKKAKKLSLDEILRGIDGLSEEEKKEVHSKMQDLYKAEDEREIDKIEEQKADNSEVADDKGEDKAEETEEIGKDVDEVEDEIANDEDETTEDLKEGEDEAEESEDESEKENTLDALMARFNALEEEHAKLSSKYDELYSKLEEREKNGKFGLAPELSEDEKDDEKTNNSVYTAYAGKNAHKYY